MFMQIVWMVALSILSALLAKKPEKPKKATLSDVNIPTATANKPIPVIFGTIWLKDPNVVWYGDLGTKAIKKKQPK